MLLAMGLAAATSIACAQTPADFDRAAIVERSLARGFESLERELIAAASSGEASSIVSLAEFYMAHDLWVEALAALKRLGADAAARAAPLAAECDYRLGRHHLVVARLESTEEIESIEAMALVRLGAFDAASAAFGKSPLPPATRLSNEFYLAKAEALAGSGDAAGAAAALRLGSQSKDSFRRKYLLGRIYLARGDALRGAAALRSAEAEDNSEWTMRARLAIAVRARDLAAIDDLGLEWRGGAFEREMQLALGELRLKGKDYDRGFAALRSVADRFPRSDDAKKAGDAIAAALPALLAAESDLDPKEAARLFFEYVEFAPAGRDGDLLIQAAAKKLEALGLYAQAARLIDHQVFKRLRGADRARVAADLADLYLLAKNPAESLRAIRSTRIAGMAPDVVQRRRRTEATALAGTGQTEAALALLSQALTAMELRLRADINWAQRNWAAAAGDYASFVSGRPSLDSQEDRTAVVRAAAAFLLAGDRAGYRAFTKEASLRLEGTAEADLIRTLGDVDRERFLANFMNSYRSVYSKSDS